MAQTRVLILDERRNVPTALAKALDAVGAQAHTCTPGDVLAASRGRMPAVTALLANATLSPHTVRSVARRLADEGQQPTVVAYAEHDLHLLDGHVRAGSDYLLPPFHPVLVQARLRDCHQHAEHNRNLEEVAAHAELLSYERELEIGREIQLGFLPDSLPSPDDWDIRVRFRPARTVAGDFYDVFELVNRRRLALVVADVCDKGVGAALFMALVRSLVRVYTQQRYTVLAAEASGAAAGAATTADGLPAAVGVTGKALQQAIILANDYIGDNHLNMNMFATMFAGVLNLKTGAIAYVNGGHNAPILLSTSGATVRLPSKSPAVGMMPGFQFSVAHAKLDPGDLLVVFSDGIPDARDPHNKFFTEARLLRLVEQAPREATAEQLAADVQETLTAHISTAAQFDDITLMVIRREHPAA